KAVGPSSSLPPSAAERLAPLPRRLESSIQHGHVMPLQSGAALGAARMVGDSDRSDVSSASLHLRPQRTGLGEVGLGPLLFAPVFPRLAPALVGVGVAGVELDRLAEIGDRPIRELPEVIRPASVVVRRGKLRRALDYLVETTDCFSDAVSL